MIFRSAEQKWALPITVIQRVVRATALSPCPGAPPQVLGLVNVQGSILPVFNFRRCLGRPDRALDTSDYFAIVEAGSRRVVLVADEVCDVLEPREAMLLQEKALPMELNRWDGLLKVSGEVVLIYNLERLLSCAEELQLTQALTVS